MPSLRPYQQPQAEQRVVDAAITKRAEEYRKQQVSQEKRCREERECALIAES